MFGKGCSPGVRFENSLSRAIGIASAIAASLSSSAAIAQISPETVEAAVITPAEQLMEQLLTLPSRYELGPANTDQDNRWPIVTEEDTSLFQLTTPSFWWSRDQMYEKWGGYRLIRSWIAFRSLSTGNPIIDIQVDPQYWNRLEYTQHYAILNQLGETGMTYGHQVRLYSSIELVGVHTCNFDSISSFGEHASPEPTESELATLQCAAAVGPFLAVFSEDDLEDLFAPP